MNLYFKVALQVIGTYGPLCRILAQAENEEMYVFFGGDKTLWSERRIES